MSNIFENKGALATTIFVAASDSLNRGAANYVCDGTDDQVEIQAAIDALPAAGGKVLLSEGQFNISASILLNKHYITLAGMGRGYAAGVVSEGAGITKIKSTSAIHLIDIELAATKLKGIQVEGLYLYGSATNNGQALIYLNDVDQAFLFNLLGNNSQYGINGVGLDALRVLLCGFFFCDVGLRHSGDYPLIADSSFSDNLTYGIERQGGYYPGKIIGCEIVRNGYGIYVNASYGIIIMGNEITFNDFDGVYFVGDVWNAKIIGNQFFRNNRYGIHLETALNSIITGNILHGNSNETDNTYDGIYLAGASNNNHIFGNTIRRGIFANKQRYGINISAAACTKNIIENNDLYDAGSTANLNDAGTCTTIKNNQDQEITDVKDYVRVKNTSGGGLVAGDVVILKSVAAGNEITTTVVLGDDKVFGMVAEAIADTAYGLVQVAGKTTALKVSGETAIVIGDFLSTHDAAGIAQQAAAGDMAFAIALEAYAVADHNGVIDALIVSPLKM